MYSAAECVKIARESIAKIQNGKEIKIHNIIIRLNDELDPTSIQIINNRGIMKDDSSIDKEIERFKRDNPDYKDGFDKKESRNDLGGIVFGASIRFIDRDNELIRIHKNITFMGTHNKVKIIESFFKDNNDKLNELAQFQLIKWLSEIPSPPKNKYILYDDIRKYISTNIARVIMEFYQ